MSESSLPSQADLDSSVVKSVHSELQDVNSSTVKLSHSVKQCDNDNDSQNVQCSLRNESMNDTPNQFSNSTSEQIDENQTSTVNTPTSELSTYAATKITNTCVEDTEGTEGTIHTTENEKPFSGCESTAEILSKSNDVQSVNDMESTENITIEKGEYTTEEYIPIYKKECDKQCVSSITSGPSISPNVQETCDSVTVPQSSNNQDTDNDDDDSTKTSEESNSEHDCQDNDSRESTPNMSPQKQQSNSFVAPESNTKQNSQDSVTFQNGTNETGKLLLKDETEKCISNGPDHSVTLQSNSTNESQSNTIIPLVVNNVASAPEVTQEAVPPNMVPIEYKIPVSMLNGKTVSLLVPISNSLVPINNALVQGQGKSLLSPSFKKISVVKPPSHSYYRALALAKAYSIESIDINKVASLVQRKNLEKPYKRPDLPGGQKDLRQMFCCGECGDTFYVLSSLSDHITRCSMVIKYNCKDCKKQMTFSNKCIFLIHVRSHGNSSSPSLNIPLQIKAEDISVLSLLHNKNPLTCGKPAVEHPKIIAANRLCTECGECIFSNMSCHFGLYEVICNFKYQCPVCSVYFASACSLSAHKRLHSAIPPFVCPECALEFPDSGKLSSHLHLVCVQNSNRMPLLVCTQCKMNFTEISKLKHHLHTHHQSAKFKCFKCNHISFTKLSHDAHREESRHVEFTLQALCKLCNSAFPKELLLHHMATHLPKMKKNVRFGYACNECKSSDATVVCLSKTDLKLHVQKHHAYKPITCLSCSEPVVREKKCEHKEDCVYYSGSTVCHYCGESVEEDLIAHLRRCTIKNSRTKDKKVLDLCMHIKKVAECAEETTSNFQCKHCNRGGMTFAQLARHVSTHAMEGNYICNKCQRADFDSYGDMKSHQIVCGLNLSAPPKVPLIVTTYKCKECTTICNTEAMLDVHMKKEHAYHPCHLCGLIYESPESLNDHVNTSHRGKKYVSLVCQLCKGRKGKSRNFSRREYLNAHMLNIHGINPDTEADNGSEKRKSESDDTPSPMKRLKILDDDLFCCAKCSYTNANAEEFSKHILVHQKKDAIQCPRCGLCFAVSLSLRRHLRLVHKLKDVDQFVQEHHLESEEEDIDIDVCPKLKDDSVDSSDETSSPDDDKRCKVCDVKFETQAERNFHMRTHGMAFIRSRQQTAKRPV